MSPKINHRRKIVSSEAEAEAWLNSRAVPKKALREGIVERAEGEDGTIVLSVSWETRPFNPRHYKMNDWLEAVLPPEEVPAQERANVEDLEPGDLITTEPWDGTLDEARIVETADETGVTLDNGTHLRRRTRPYNPYGFSASEARPNRVGRFPARLRARVEERIELEKSVRQRIEREGAAA